jgi:hypothetical protein
LGVSTNGADVAEDIVVVALLHVVQVDFLTPPSSPSLN